MYSHLGLIGVYHFVQRSCVPVIEADVSRQCIGAFMGVRRISDRGGGQIEKPEREKSIIRFLNCKNIYLNDFHYVFE